MHRTGRVLATLAVILMAGIATVKGVTDEWLVALAGTNNAADSMGAGLVTPLASLSAFETSQPASGEQGLGAPLRIYMRANGNDEYSGLSEQESVRSLWRVQQILDDMDFERSTWTIFQNRNVEVHISPYHGKYYNQSMSPSASNPLEQWTITNPKYFITFMPLNNSSTRPIFNGCAGSAGPCHNRTFFRIDKEGPTNLVFYYIRVEQYNNGIVFVGPRGRSADNSNNTIYGSYFYQIGDLYTDEPNGAEVVAFDNSDYNTVANNHFIKIERHESPGSLHAVYIAHDSDHNLIHRNRIVDNRGDPIRVRDASDFNVITENQFIKVGQTDGAAYTEWVGDGERLSCENVFRNNFLDGRFNCRGPLRDFKYLENFSDVITCSQGYRLHTRGNTTTSTPCLNY